MKKNLTIVTALFDLGRDNLVDGFRRPFSQYLECFAKMLKVDYPMVIYCDTDVAEFVWQHRSPDNTRIIHKSIDDLRKFPFYDQVQKIRNNPDWYNRAGWLPDSPQSKMELYSILTFFKQFFLNDASLMNHFDSRYYLWVDAGLSNTIGNPAEYFDAEFEKRISGDMNRMLYVAFPYDGEVEVHGFEKSAMNRMAGVDTKFVCRGGIFGGTRHTLNEINDIYYGLLAESLNNGLMGTEESIFSIIAHKHPEKCNVRMIESNGLVYKYLQDLKRIPIESIGEELAFYFLTYNTPKQFELMIKNFKESYPDEFSRTKKYVVDNSTDTRAAASYKKMFSEYDIECIHGGENLGIQDGRQLVAEHFDKSVHKYYVFFEEDFFLVGKDYPSHNKNGFIRYVPELFRKGIDIVDFQNLDYLKLSIIEFYGECTQDWAFKNVPDDKKKIYFPEREDGNAELRWKTKIDYIGFREDLAYGVGHFHVDNWPHIMTKKGNHQIYLADPYAHKFEQTIMSQCKTYLVEGKLIGGCLLAAPIEHNRTIHYNGKTRRENKFYTN